MTLWLILKRSKETQPKLRWAIDGLWVALQLLALNFDSVKSFGAVGVNTFDKQASFLATN